MSDVLKVLVSVRTPISLAAAALGILYLLSQLILRSKTLPSIGPDAAANLLKTIVNWIGALALIAVVMVLLPTVVAAFVSRGSNPKLDHLVNQMITNYNQGFRDQAKLRADEVLQLDPANAQALNIKGGLSFYSQNYQEAISYFTRALASKPNDPVFEANLAAAYVEVGGYDKALKIYNSPTVNDGSEDARYAIGRVYLYKNMPDHALELLKTVPDEYDCGSARILSAAALATLYSRAENPAKRSKFLASYKSQLSEGKAQCPEYWRGILSGKRKDEHEGFAKVISMLGEIHG